MGKDRNVFLAVNVINSCVCFIISAVPSAAPSNLSCIAVDESHIQCAWLPPPREHRNGRIIGYKIRYKASHESGSVKKSFGNSLLNTTLADLQAYTEYQIDVAAKSSKGQGPFSNRVVVTTDETSK